MQGRREDNEGNGLVLRWSCRRSGTGHTPPLERLQGVEPRVHMTDHALNAAA